MTYSLRFAERMTGAFAFGEGDYRVGYETGHKVGNGVVLRLTIAVDDVDSFVADPQPGALASGYLKCDVLGGRLPLRQGTFDLCADPAAAARRTLYRLPFTDATGRALTLAGFAVWPEASILYFRILRGHVAVTDGGSGTTEGLVGSGILRISPVDLARQLTTLRVHGPTIAGRVRALAAFGRLFMGQLRRRSNPQAHRHG